MKSIAVKKLGQYLLFWLGPFLLVAGCSAALVSGRWEPVSLGLLISGIVLIVVWLWFQAYRTRWWERRSTQASTNAFVATLSVLVILALLNFLGTRYAMRVDLTENHLFTLAPESRHLLQQLQQPTKAFVFDRNPNPQDKELLQNYQRQGAKFSFDYVDPQAQPGLAKKFGVKDFGAVYLEANQEQKFVQVVNDTQRLSEVKLTTAIEQIQTVRVNNVYFLQSHGELALSPQGGNSTALNSLKDKNFITESLNLTQQPIPQDATVVVVNGPKQGLFDREVKALNDYLIQGGSLLLMIDPNTNPNLDNLLKGWGVKLDDSFVVDVSGQAMGFGPAVALVSQYGNHPITKDFGNRYSFYPLARPIQLTPALGVQATPLLLTNPYPQSWSHNILNQDLKFDPKRDRPGPLILGAALSRQAEAKAGKKPSESRLVVLGNSDFATDGRFEQQLNGDVFLNSISWLSQQDNELLSIRPKQEKNRRINLTKIQASLLTWMSLVLFPALGLAIALLLWWTRR